MEYRQHQLDNGLTILAECNPRAYMSAFGFFVRAGSRDETPEIGGVSHFLEHILVGNLSGGGVSPCYAPTYGPLWSG